MKKLKICIITGSRAEWGLFYPLASKIKKSRSGFILQIIATGGHLSPDFGFTYREIERDGFSIDKKVKSLVKGDSARSIADSVSLGITGIVRAIEWLKPDLVLLLGDRFETFAAAIATFLLKIPIGHIHGGELTQGSLDDGMRHAITKMSYLHFTATESYRKRIIQLGECPDRVFNVGAMGLDSIKQTKLLSREEFEKKINFKLSERNVLVTFHPATLEDKSVLEKQLMCLLQALDELKDAKIIFTKPNPDIFSKTLTKLVDSYVADNKDKTVSFPSLGRKVYLSALKFVDVVVGNSSSGIIEAPSFGIPTINIGTRQQGRVRGSSVIDAQGSLDSIRKAFKKAFSPSFRNFCRKAQNPYGQGNASGKIIAILTRIDLRGKDKTFFDIC